jgi:hypothetical protein
MPSSPSAKACAAISSRGHAASEIAIMPNGVDLALFGQPLERDAEFARSLGLGDGPVIGFLGSFYPL